MPVTHRAAPSNRCESVCKLLEATLRSITKRREIWNHSHVPENQRHSEIGTDCEDVPKKWTAELRPHLHRVWNWKEPICKPDATHVNSWKESSANNCEDGHRFCKSIDSRAPLLTEEKENRRDQSSGVTNTDPENEVGDVVRPHDWVIQSPHANASEDEICHAEAQESHHSQTNNKRDIPRHRRTIFCNATNLVSDLSKLVHVQHKRCTRACWLLRVIRFDEAFRRIRHD